MKNTYSFTWSWLLVISIATPIIAITIIDTPHGQFSCPGGGTACTAIDMAAAIHLLAMPSKAWHTLKPDQLAQLIKIGTQRYTQAINQLKKPAGLFFQAFEAAPAFPELQQADIMTVLAVMPTPEFLPPGEQVTTPDLLALSIKQVKTPVCGIWTQHGSSQLICYKDNTWLFLDSHRQSTGANGASIRVFDNETEFQNFVNTHHVFHIGTGSTWDQANLTLFRLKQAPAKPQPTKKQPRTIALQAAITTTTKRVHSLNNQLAASKKQLSRTKARAKIASIKTAIKKQRAELEKAQKTLAALTKQQRAHQISARITAAQKALARATTNKQKLEKKFNRKKLTPKQRQELVQAVRIYKQAQKNLAALKHQAK